MFIWGVHVGGSSQKKKKERNWKVNKYICTLSCTPAWALIFIPNPENLYEVFINLVLQKETILFLYV
jgi:hypothetical protein